MKSKTRPPLTPSQSDLVVSHVRLALLRVNLRRRELLQWMTDDEIKSFAYAVAIDAATKFRPDYVSQHTGEFVAFSTFLCAHVKLEVFHFLRSSRCKFARLAVVPECDMSVGGGKEFSLTSVIQDPIDDDGRIDGDDMMRHLTAREKLVIRRRFWYDSSFKEIAAELSVTRERARQIYETALHRLRVHVREIAGPAIEGT